MSTRIKTTVALLGVAVLLLPAATGAADEGKKFSRADFERCNQQAMLIGGVETEWPAALPGGTQPGTQQGMQPPSQPATGMTGTGTGMSGTSTTGGGTGMTGTIGSGTGMTGSGTDTSLGAASNHELASDRPGLSRLPAAGAGQLAR